MSLQPISLNHWGEIPEPSASSGISDADWEQVTTNRPIELESSDRHQPSSVEFKPSEELPALCSEMDPLIIHTIKLMQHSRTLTGLIESYNCTRWKDDQGVDSPYYFSTPPSIPEGPTWKPKHTFMYPFHFMEKKFSNFTLGEGNEPIEITAKVSRSILKKSTAALLVHSGFDTTMESVLDTLTDICDEFLKKMTQLLRHNIDRDSLMGPSGFPDVVERIFHDMGIGSVLVIHGYYQSKVVRNHEQMLKQCQDLTEEYEKLRHPASSSVGAQDYYRDRMQDQDEDVPEIHFPAPEDGEEVFSEHAQQTLEPGFQMLQSLEQEAAAAEEAHSQQISLPTAVEPDSDEIINVNDSPVALSQGSEQNPPSVSASDSAQSPSSLASLGGRQAKKRKRR